MSRSATWHATAGCLACARWPSKKTDQLGNGDFPHTDLEHDGVLVEVLGLPETTDIRTVVCSLAPQITRAGRTRRRWVVAHADLKGHMHRFGLIHIVPSTQINALRRCVAFVRDVG